MLNIFLRTFEVSLGEKMEKIRQNTSDTKQDTTAIHLDFQSNEFAATRDEWRMHGTSEDTFYISQYHQKSA